MPVALGTVLSKFDGSVTPTDPSTASISNLMLPAGTYTITATYSGDANNAGSSAVGLAPTITTVAGNGTDAYSSADGSIAQTASIALGNGGPSSPALDSAGDLFIADPSNNAIREVNLSGGPIILPDGSTLQVGQTGTVATGLNQPEGVAVAGGNLYIADTGANLVQMLNLTGSTETIFGQVVANDGMITIAGDRDGINFNSGIYGGGAATLAPVASPEAIAVDNQGDVFIAVGAPALDQLEANWYQNAILEVSPNDTIVLTAGLPVPRGNTPSQGSTSLAYDATTQRLYFSLEFAGFVGYFDINQSGPYEDLGGGDVGMDTVYTAAGFNGAHIEGLAVDAAGDLYIANSSNNAIQEVAANDIIGVQGFNTDALTWNITVAGNGMSGYSGDNGPATLAALSDPTGLAVNAGGDLFITDTGNYRVREVLPASPLQILSDTSTSDVSANDDLQNVVDVAPSFTLQATVPSDASYLISAINQITEPTINGTPTPVTVTLDLGESALDNTVTQQTYGDTLIALQPGVKLVIVGNGTTTIGGSPALTVESGDVEYLNETFTTATAAPTILVEGGTLTLRNDTIDSSTGYSEPAIEVTGGTVDLGTSGSPGGNTLVINRTGQFIQNSTSNPVPTVGDTFVQATPVITWAAPANITYGTALCSTQLDATANVAGTFAYTPAAGTVLKAGTGQTLSVTFTPSDTTDYTTATAKVTINVNQATPVITWAAPANITYGTALCSTQLDATANVAGTFVYTPAAGTVLKAGTGQTLSVTFTPSDTTDYTTVTDSVTINVTVAAGSIYVLDPTAGGALSLSGNASINTSGNVVVDSNFVQRHLGQRQRHSYRRQRPGGGRGQQEWKCQSHQDRHSGGNRRPACRPSCADGPHLHRHSRLGEPQR